MKLSFDCPHSVRVSDVLDDIVSSAADAGDSEQDEQGDSENGVTFLILPATPIPGPNSHSVTLSVWREQSEAEEEEPREKRLENSLRSHLRAFSMSVLAMVFVPAMCIASVSFWPVRAYCAGLAASLPLVFLREDKRRGRVLTTQLASLLRRVTFHRLDTGRDPFQIRELSLA